MLRIFVSAPAATFLRPQPVVLRTPPALYRPDKPAAKPTALTPAPANPPVPGIALLLPVVLPPPVPPREKTAGPSLTAAAALLTVALVLRPTPVEEEASLMFAAAATSAFPPRL